MPQHAPHPPPENNGVQADVRRSSANPSPRSPRSLIAMSALRSPVMSARSQRTSSHQSMPGVAEQEVLSMCRCGRPFDERSKFCSSCGAPAEKVQLNFCRCGRLFGANEKFCSYCGHSSQDQESINALSRLAQQQQMSAVPSSSPRSTSGASSLTPSPRSIGRSPRSARLVLTGLRSPRHSTQTQSQPPSQPFSQPQPLRHPQPHSVGSASRPDWVPPLTAPVPATLVDANGYSTPLQQHSARAAPVQRNLERVPPVVATTPHQKVESGKSTPAQPRSGASTPPVPISVVKADRHRLAMTEERALAALPSGGRSGTSTPARECTPTGLVMARMERPAPTTGSTSRGASVPASPTRGGPWSPLSAAAARPISRTQLPASVMESQRMQAFAPVDLPLEVYNPSFAASVQPSSSPTSASFIPPTLREIQAARSAGPSRQHTAPSTPTYAPSIDSRFTTPSVDGRFVRGSPGATPEALGRSTLDPIASLAIEDGSVYGSRGGKSHSSLGSLERPRNSSSSVTVSTNRKSLIEILEYKFFGSVENPVADEETCKAQSSSGTCTAPGENPNPSWGYYAHVPIFSVLVNFAMVAAQFTVYLSLVGWVDTFLEPSSDAVRGLVNLFVPGWSVAIYATFSELLLGRPATCIGGVGSAVAFTAACVGLASLPMRLGFVVQVLGGVLIHFTGMTVWGLVAMIQGGTTRKESLVRVGYFLTLFACVFLTAVNGYFACFWWPILDDQYSPWIAGPALSLASNFGEGVGVMAVKRLDKLFYKQIPNSRTMGSWTIMYVHSVSESFRLVSIWYSAIRAPENFGWIAALAFGVCTNMMIRLGWNTYIAWRLTFKHPFWIPGCWTMVHRGAKYGFGYCRFGAPLAVVGARYILGTKETLFFNGTVLSVWLGSFAAELLEDIGTAFLESQGCQPRWYSDRTVLEYVDAQNSRDPDNATVAVYRKSEGHLSSKVSSLNVKPFESPLLALSITNSSTFLAYSGLIVLVSLQYLLGAASHPVSIVDTIHNGAFMWHT